MSGSTDGNNLARMGFAIVLIVAVLAVAYLSTTGAETRFLQWAIAVIVGVGVAFGVVRVWWARQDGQG